jgi:hypothetical protein
LLVARRAVLAGDRARVRRGRGLPRDRRAAAARHAAIARFVERHERALGELFGEVLGLCADAGLATVGVIAIDGTKVAANANRDQAMNYEQIARAIVDEAIDTDAAETALWRSPRR